LPACLGDSHPDNRSLSATDGYVRLTGGQLVLRPPGDVALSLVTAAAPAARRLGRVLGVRLLTRRTCIIAH
jgi:hypothetical protein